MKGVGLEQFIAWENTHWALGWQQTEWRKSTLFKRLVGLCAMSPNEAIWCGSDRDATVETGCFCAMIQEQLSVFGVDQP